MRDGRVIAYNKSRNSIVKFTILGDFLDGVRERGGEI